MCLPRVDWEDSGESETCSENDDMGSSRSPEYGAMRQRSLENIDFLVMAPMLVWTVEHCFEGSVLLHYQIWRFGLILSKEAN